MGDNGISSNVWSSLLLFHCKVQIPLDFVYSSFLLVKQRDFPGNVRSGGCDSLPLVVAFTSKQRDSPLSYALHFLRIISHQMCCAGERAEGRTEGFLHLPAGNAGAVGAFSGLSGQPALCFNPKLEEKEVRKEKEQKSQICISHRRWRPR